MSRQMQPVRTVAPSFKTYKYRQPPRRLILSLEALERQGKTHLALTAPGPLGYMQMDPGGEDVVPKAQQLFPTKTIHHANYVIDIDPHMDDQKKSDLALEIWTQSVSDYRHAIGAGKFRSLVIDTASEWFTCLRIARFGRLTQVMPEQYGPVYAEFRSLLRQAYASECNVILLHKLKDEYVDGGTTETGKRKAGKKTGNLVRDGYKAVGFEVQMVARAYKEDGVFMVEVINCRQNPDIDGMQVPVDAESGFAQLGMLAYPDSDESDWR